MTEKKDPLGPPAQARSSPLGPDLPPLALTILATNAHGRAEAVNQPGLHLLQRRFLNSPGGGTARRGTCCGASDRLGRHQSPTSPASRWPICIWLPHHPSLRSLTGKPATLKQGRQVAAGSLSSGGGAKGPFCSRASLRGSRASAFLLRGHQGRRPGAFLG